MAAHYGGDGGRTGMSSQQQPSPRKASSAATAAFHAHQPNVYVHTSTIEAVLAPIAEQLSNLIMIMANAEAQHKPIPDLTAPATAIVDAGDNLINVGMAAIDDGDDELKRSMPISCQNLRDSAKLFDQGTAGLKINPHSSPDRDLLVEGVRGLLAGTTQILISYDSFDVRKMVNICNSILQQLKEVQQRQFSTKFANVDDILENLDCDVDKLKPLVEERADELRNDTHRRTLTEANGRLEVTLPLFVSSVRAAMRLSSSHSQQSAAYASKELHDTVTQIVSVLTATDVDDKNFKANTGTIAASINHAREELFGNAEDVAIRDLEMEVLKAVGLSSAAVKNVNRNSALFSVLEDIDLCLEGDKNDEESVAMMTIARQKLQKGELSELEVNTMLEKQKSANPELERRGLSPEPPSDENTARVAVLCKEITTMLAELKGAPTDAAIAAFQGKLYNLDTALKTVAVDEMTEATLVDEYPAEHLIEAAAAADDGTALDGEIGKFQTLTARMVHAVELVAGTSTDATRNEVITATAKRLQEVSTQMVNIVKVVRANPEDKDVLNQRELLKSNYNEDLEKIKDTVTDMVQAPVSLDADYSFVKSIADTAIKAARTGYPAAARAAVRKLRKRIGHVITVTTVEMENTIDEGYKSKLDTALLAVEDVDPTIAEAMTALGADSSNVQVIDAFEATLRTAVSAVLGLKVAAESSTRPSSLIAEIMPTLVDSTMKVQQVNVIDNGEFIEGTAANAREVEVDLQPSVAVQQSTPLHSVKQAQMFDEAAIHKTPLTDPSVNDSMAAFEISPADIEMPVMKAAVKLRREANKWSVVGNPIVGAAKEMANAMAHMARISGAKSGDMGDMINTAKTIIEHAKTLIRWAKGLAAKCSDKRLIADINHGCERIQTIGIQLKIVSSVNAMNPTDSSGETDPVLVLNAQHLMDEAQHLVRSCESASLKLLSGSGPEIQWKRRSIGQRTSTHWG